MDDEIHQFILDMDGLDGVLGGLCAITSRHERTSSVGRRLALNRSGFVCHGLGTRAYTVEHKKGLYAGVQDAL
jgi:hypothetical protein